MAIFLSSVPNLSTSMRVGNAIYRIKFVPRDKPYNDGILAVGDEHFADAIRKHPYFGSIIKEKLDEKPAAPVVEEKSFAAVYPGVTKSQDAKEILVGKHGAEPDKLTSKAAIKKAAEELNISFPDLK